jgi:hypothetical protein
MSVKSKLKGFGIKLLAAVMGSWAFGMAWLFVSPLWDIVPGVSARTALSIGGALLAALGTDALLGWRFGPRAELEKEPAREAAKAQPQQKQSPAPGAKAPGRYVHRLCGSAFDEPIVQTDFVTNKKEWVCPVCWRSMGDVKDGPIPAPVPAHEPVLPPAPAPVKEQTVIRLVIEGPVQVQAKAEGPA